MVTSTTFRRRKPVLFSGLRSAVPQAASPSAATAIAAAGETRPPGIFISSIVTDWYPTEGYAGLRSRDCQGAVTAMSIQRRDVLKLSASAFVNNLGGQTAR